ncbi:MAG: protein kinase [Desulfobacteraceae bacterium]|nr:protein kinase [Desulfobacteraceae bacterium]
MEHYRILKLLGKGAMGEVYLAEDTRLKRSVALKVLAAELRREEEIFRRFKIEAEAAARLNHPNIATLYTIEEIDEHWVIAMEYIDGVPLKERISEAGLDLETFFEWFLPLAEALAHAHERNVIHRDIKPGNIMISRENGPKILDFGLARIHREKEGDPSNPAGEQSLTQIGTIMGSPAYMSPEQAAGAKMDQRTDIFSFGIVMYEALTGKKPFKGRSFQEIITSVLRDEPVAITSLRPDIPYLLAHIIAKALQKDLRKRYQTVQDIVNDLRAAKKDRALQINREEFPAEVVAGTAGSIQPVNRKSSWHWLLIIGLLLAAGVLGGLLWRTNTAPTAPSGQRIFKIPMEGASSSVAGGGPAISPDGQMIAYVQGDRLRLMNLTSGQWSLVQDTSSVEGQPFWSPDSRYLCYFTNMGRTIRKLTIKDSQSVTLCDISAQGYAGAGSWSGRGEIIFDLWGGDWTRGLGLLKVSQEGGSPQTLLPPDPEKGETYQAPWFLPESRGLLYVKVFANGQSELMVKSDGIDRSLVKRTEGLIFYPIYCPPGYLLYQAGVADHNSIWAVPFSLIRLETTGEPFLVAENAAWPSVSADGTLAFMSDPPFEQQLVWLSRNGQLLSTVGPALSGTQIGGLALRADQAKVAMDGFDTGFEEIWLVDIARGARSRLTYSGARDAEATWSPDGKQLVYASERDGLSDLFIQNADPGAQAEKIVGGGGDKYNPSWSSDGRFLAYEQLSAKTKRDLWYLPLNPGSKSAGASAAGQPVLFLQTPFDETMPQISPDGRWIAFMSDISGRWEVYVRPFPEGSGEWQISVRGGGYPCWSGRGDELFFVEGDLLMSAKVHTRPEIKVDLPVKLFKWKHLGLYFSRRFQPNTDGARFLVVQENSQDTPLLNIVENWRKGITAK